MKAAVYLRFCNGPFPRQYRLDVAEDVRARHLFEAITRGETKFCRAHAAGETLFVNAQQATEIIYREYE